MTTNEIARDITRRRPLYVVEPLNEDRDWFMAYDINDVDPFSAGFDTECEAIAWAFDRNGPEVNMIDNIIWDVLGERPATLRIGGNGNH